MLNKNFFFIYLNKKINKYFKIQISDVSLVD
jgi:hypothetical protein